MNRMGPVILVLAAANAVLAATMAGAAAAVAVFLMLLAAGFLFFRNRGAPSAPDRAPPPEAIAVGRQGGLVVVRLGGHDRLARPAEGTPMPGYGDRVRILGAEGEVLVVRAAPGPRTGA
jgi:hypothetical protein